MAIIFNCPGCKGRMQAPDSLAGQKARCPNCQLVVEVPQQILEAEQSPAYPAPRSPDAPPLHGSGAPGRSSFPFEDAEEFEDTAGEKRPCPMCGEMIMANAIKCRYCGEIFDPALRRQGGDPKKRRDMYRQMNGIGGLWIFFGSLVLLLVVFASDKLVDMAGEGFPIVAGALALCWLVFGIGTCMKQMWAVYAGLIFSYLVLLVNLAGLAMMAGQGGGQVGNPICGFVLLIAGIVQAHRVISISGELNRG